MKHLQREVQKEPRFEKVTELLGVRKDASGYLRCMGRMGRSKMPFSIKYPLLLPSRHWVTTLIIWNCHDKVYHYLCVVSRLDLCGG